MLILTHFTTSVAGFLDTFLSLMVAHALDSIFISSILDDTCRNCLTWSGNSAMNAYAMTWSSIPLNSIARFCRSADVLLKTACRP